MILVLYLSWNQAFCTLFCHQITTRKFVILWWKIIMQNSYSLQGWIQTRICYLQSSINSLNCFRKSYFVIYTNRQGISCLKEEMNFRICSNTHFIQRIHLSFFCHCRSLRKQNNFWISRYWMAIVAYFPKRNVKTYSTVNFGKILSKRHTKISRGSGPSRSKHTIIRFTVKLDILLIIHSQKLESKWTVRTFLYLQYNKRF